ncbi:Homeobox domain-containing protein/HALZ domain-containing protein [Cephalotus follicularis]|uniref:Homeobox-leucine zipper protein n=1 Tax=Cephalotus follicularis TaxID=3775 RepID=A0A1Q3CSM5_CEPFO|nr:Homeobox domain-containing protein/HALZ domain-containing protein [Cephalotus follicularis]
MKRFCSSDSMAALISVCPPTEENVPKSKQMYSKEFQALLDGIDDEDYREEASQTTVKKRRLSFNQVKALEKNFETENKLEPERKSQLAEELGLQPRQVAIWFQNRRARWKTKQLEKDFALLKANFDALKHDYNNLEQENRALNTQLKDLTAKLGKDNADSSHSVKEESPISETENNVTTEESTKHGLCYNVNAHEQQLVSPASSSSCALHFTPTSTSPQSVMEWFQLTDSRTVMSSVYQTQLVKLEEQSNLFSAEESCNFFSVDQAPTLQWYFTGQ